MGALSSRDVSTPQRTSAARTKPPRHASSEDLGGNRVMLFSPFSREAPVISRVYRCPTSENFHSYVVGRRAHLSSRVLSKRVEPFLVTHFIAKLTS